MLSQAPAATRAAGTARSRRIAELARASLEREIACWPKPGLVSLVDRGSHRDMDAALMLSSAAVLEPFFGALAEAGAGGADMDALRRIGRAAEAAMLAATGGVNTHRGAIFGLGLLCAAAGAQAGDDRHDSLGDVVRRRWGDAIRRAPVAADSHGGRAALRHGVGGARGEAAAGFPAVYRLGLPALRRAPADSEAARVAAIFALVAGIDDTNLLHRGGAAGLAFAQAAARDFLARGGTGTPGWRDRAARVHAAFVARDLSPGGAADLLAMTLFVDEWERP